MGNSQGRDNTKKRKARRKKMERLALAKAKKQKPRNSAGGANACSGGVSPSTFFQNAGSITNFPATFRVAREEPAEIGEAVQVAKNFAIELWIGGDQGGDAAFGAAARRSRQVQGRRRSAFARNGPVLEFLEPVLFQVVNGSGEAVGHRGGGELKAVFHVAVRIFSRGGEFAHDGNEFPFARRESVRRRKNPWAEARARPSGRVQFINATVGIDACVSFRDPPPIHERRFAFVTGLGRDRHKKSSHHPALHRSVG